MVNATQWANIAKDFVGIVTFGLAIKSSWWKIEKTRKKGLESRGDRTYT